MRLLSLRTAPVAVLSLAAFAACRVSPSSMSRAPTPTAVRSNYATGEEVIAAMHARYERRWYSTLTFIQKTSRLQADGTWNVQTWYEAIKVPGRLRIDIEPISAGNGLLNARDSAFTIRNGQLVVGKPSINPLLLLGFDVYANPPARTAALLRKEGYDLSRVHADTLDGHPMVIVGAQAGDAISKQFWIDAEHLYFVRMLGPATGGTAKVQDVRFMNYQPRGDAWVAPRVEIHTDGQLVFFEDYSDITTNMPLDDALFDPYKWKTARHWFAQ